MDVLQFVFYICKYTILNFLSYFSASGVVFTAIEIATGNEVINYVVCVHWPIYLVSDLSLA